MSIEFKHAILAAEIMKRPNVLNTYEKTLKDIIPPSYQEAGQAVVEVYQKREGPSQEETYRQAIINREDNAIAKLYGVSMTVRQIGTFLGHNREWVRSRLIAMGVEPLEFGPLPDSLIKEHIATPRWHSHRDRIIQEFLAGTKVRELVKKYGCSDQTIYRYLHTAGIPTHGNGGKSEIQLAKSIITRFLEGEKVEILAQENNCSGETIRRFLKKNGVKLKKGRQKSK